jgi:hypothetical protein
LVTFATGNPQGPCGILSLALAYAVVESSNELHKLDEAAVYHCIANGLARMLERVNPVRTKVVCVREECADDVCAMCLAGEEAFLDPLTADRLEIREFSSREELAAMLRSQMPQWASDGTPSVVLLLYSIVLTRGVAEFAREAREDPMVRTLIYDDGCSEQALLNVALTGVGRNHVDDAAWCDWPGTGRTDILDVGFLTDADGFLPGDHFKNPANSVFILNSGGHYTTLWFESSSEQRPSTAAADDDDHAAASSSSTPSSSSTTTTTTTAKVVSAWHFNGLHPPNAGGKPTRLTHFHLSLEGPGEGAVEEDPQEIENQARKIKQIMQFNTATGLFLVVCEKDGSMESSGLDVPEYWPQRWYCRDCTLVGDYAGYNYAEATECKACLRPARECGWAHWLTEAQLPRKLLSTWKKNRVPPMLRVLRIRWPQADASWDGAPPPALFG